MSAPIPQTPAPAANPYGSYVSAQQPSYPQDAPSHLDAAGYRNGYVAGQQAVAGGNWYGSADSLTQQPGQANGFLPAPANGANGSATNGSATNGSATNGRRGRHGYPPIDYSNLTYPDSVYPDPLQGAHQQGSHQQPPDQQALNGHAAPYDQRGHYPADGASAQDARQGYPGYGNGNGRY